jgi:hypothetical protein
VRPWCSPFWDVTKSPCLPRGSRSTSLEGRDKGRRLRPLLQALARSGLGLVRLIPKGSPCASLDHSHGQPVAPANGSPARQPVGSRLTKEARVETWWAWAGQAVRVGGTGGIESRPIAATVTDFLAGFSSGRHNKALRAGLWILPTSHIDLLDHFIGPGQQ